MKTGKSIVELAQEIMRQAETKHDYLASTGTMTMLEPAASPTGQLALSVGAATVSDDLAFGVTNTAHEHIATEAGIPKAYYDRMKAEKPALLAENVNEWFAAKPNPRMLRTLDGNARAMLSPGYRPLDNERLAEAALPALAEAGMDIVSCELTERRIYIKAVNRKIERYLPVGSRMGDGSHHGFKVPSGEVIPAIEIRNSEIGYSQLEVVSGYLDGGCTNLMWFFKERGMKRRHVGARLDLGEDLYRQLTDETHRATDKAIWLQFRDTVKLGCSEEGFDEIVDKLRDATTQEFEADPIKVVEITAKLFSLNEKQHSSVLQHLIRGGNLNQFGLANAITSAAEDEADYDVATDLEHLGGKVIELPKNEWRQIATASPKLLKAA